MRIAFLADIHANLHALKACLVSAAGMDVDRYVFLGDIVGYGADPKACVDIVAELNAMGAIVIRGNHDEAVASSRFRLNDAAATAIEWTQAVLGPEQKAFLAGLPLSVVEDDRLYVHASADEPAAFHYVHGLQEARESLAEAKSWLTIVGHVHIPALYNLAVTGKVMGFIPIEDNDIPLLSQRRWLAVMGAVGQPRDGNPAAAWGLYDTGRRAMTYIRVPYDIDGAAARIRSAGLPEILWKRLSVGR